jgi:hypothetical protein
MGHQDSRAVTIPDNKVILIAFRRGQELGAKRTKYGRTQCPYGESRPYQRDAWLAGYDWEYS